MSLHSYLSETGGDADDRILCVMLGFYVAFLIFIGILILLGEREVWQKGKLSEALRESLDKSS